ncbi:MAG TPA: flagellar filament capping protein FliD [Planctomicrobium sp.]|nr:flagellar filament capping protein FliD [Planctomicrobium sp.]
MSGINIGGLVSGIDTDVIIEGLMKIQQNQLDLINFRKTDVETKKSAYQSMQTQLLTLRTTATTLAGNASNPFDSRMTTVSHPDSIVATAASRASTGTYQIKVNSLATAHTVTSQGITNPDSAITEGTFSIRVGTQAQSDIVIDSSNNTLRGLADSINFANAGVTASIVQDSSSSYRLMLTAQKTGAENTISVTNTLADGDENAVRPMIDFDNPVEAAADAQVTLGSGSGAITVSSSTNTVTNLIQGVTLNLQSADPSKSITVTVANDTEKASNAVKDFVEAYNTFLDFVDNVTKYDQEADVGGVLQGDYSALNIRSQIQSMIQSVIPGLSSQANRLSALGISTANNGRLILNETRLNAFINGNVEGVTTTDLKRLFAIDGQSSNGAVSFIFASAKTAATTSPIEVNVTQAPLQAKLMAGSELAESTVIDESTNSLMINLDGVETTLQLKAGTYTREELASHVQSVINNHSSFAGRGVSVGVDSANQLSMTSNSYGSSSRLTLYSSSALSSLGFSGGESNVGKNVAGEFIINGKAETATGNGRILTGTDGNEMTDGLQVRVNVTPGQVTSGTEGSITLTRGVASKMNSLIDKLLDADRGILVTLEKRFEEQINTIQTQVTRNQELFDKQKESLLARFQAMETALQQMQSLSSMLGTQLAGLGSMSSSRK